MPDQLQKLADAAHGEIRGAILRAVEETRQAVNVDALTTAILERDVAAIEAALGLDADGFRALEDALQDGDGSPGGILASLVIGAAAIAAAVLRPGFTVNVGGQAREQARHTISEIAQESARAARLTALAIAEGSESPYDRAARLRAAIGLTERQAANLGRFREALINPVFRARIIAGDTVRQFPVMRNLSASQRASVRRAIREGVTPDSAERILEAHRRALLTHRANAIATTEAQRAVNVGELTAWQHAADQGVIGADARRYWRTAGDERVRHSHSLIPGMNSDGVPLRGTFNTPFGSLMGPPAEVNCRCRVELRQTGPLR